VNWKFGEWWEKTAICDVFAFLTRHKNHPISSLPYWIASLSLSLLDLWITHWPSQIGGNLRGSQSCSQKLVFLFDGLTYWKTLVAKVLFIRCRCSQQSYHRGGKVYLWLWLWCWKHKICGNHLTTDSLQNLKFLHLELNASFNLEKVRRL